MGDGTADCGKGHVAVGADMEACEAYKASSADLDGNHGGPRGGSGFMARGTTWAGVVDSDEEKEHSGSAGSACFDTVDDDGTPTLCGSAGSASGSAGSARFDTVVDDGTPTLKGSVAGGCNLVVDGVSTLVVDEVEGENGEFGIDLTVGVECQGVAEAPRGTWASGVDGDVDVETCQEKATEELVVWAKHNIASCDGDLGHCQMVCGVVNGSTIPQTARDEVRAFFIDQVVNHSLIRTKVEKRPGKKARMRGKLGS